MEINAPMKIVSMEATVSPRLYMTGYPGKVTLIILRHRRPGVAGEVGWRG